ncbi:phage tail assembly protein [Streptomyces sp. MJM1172]|uniref:phage tail assembly protein n=1 Tax=Streptomyces sp. MJM1172 TaxID=1703926 RepID=UPI00093FC180|nr:phage tail assembly protein [Streptomyces sp. MJM1172]OKI71417.1 hypothetical protein AMK15_01970 [Streptomyces sp. MJM1172]
MTKISFEDLVAEVEQSYKAVQLEMPDGNVVNLRALAVLPRHERRGVTDAIKVVNSKTSDADKQESAIDAVLLAASDRPDLFESALDAMPLGAKAKLIQVWSEETQAPEA